MYRCQSTSQLASVGFRITRLYIARAHVFPILCLPVFRSIGSQSTAAGSRKLPHVITLLKLLDFCMGHVESSDSSTLFLTFGICATDVYVEENDWVRLRNEQLIWRRWSLEMKWTMRWPSHYVISILNVEFNKAFFFCLILTR